MDIIGTYVEVQPPARLVYRAPLNTEVSVQFHDHGSATAVALEHGQFPSERVRENWIGH
jgi:Activator of Hsp90 ATPase homolog 1-like protein